jgi:hypothetical protein
LATEFAARLCGYLSILITAMAPDEKVTAADEREGFASQLCFAALLRSFAAHTSYRVSQQLDRKKHSA